MVSAYDRFMDGAKQARRIAAECLAEAETADTARGLYLIAEYDRHMDRADWYESHASLFERKTNQEIAA